VPLSDAAIAAANPWWTKNDWEADDGHLRRLAAQPVRLPAQVAPTITIGEAGTHVLRGPRQVGKSTELKLLVRRALAEGLEARRVVYLSWEDLSGEHHTRAAESVVRAKTLARPEGPCLILLDEVTAIPDWQLAVKRLFDTGETDRDTVVCTGSSAVDLRRGVKERLPGRRGAGSDHFVAPRSFASFASALDDGLLATPGLTPAQVAGAEAEELLQDAMLSRARLDRALDLYGCFGGLPAAVAEAACGALDPSEATYRIVADALLGETLRRGASEAATYALLERVLRSLGSKVSWPALARDMDVPLGRRSGSAEVRGETVRSYIEFLAACYMLFVVYYWRHDSDSSVLSRDKKVYFADPLLHAVSLQAAPGLRVNTPALVENLVAAALFRSSEPPSRQADSYVDPDALHVYGTAAGGEIDFVCGPRAAAVPVEVRYQRSPDLRKAAAVPRAFPGRRAIIVSKETLLFRERYVVVPASVFLWALG